MLTMDATATGSLTALGQAVSQILEWMGTTVTKITSDPLLLIPVAIFVVGACIGLAGRLIGRG